MKYLSNPNFIYVITFTAPFLVYFLGWSTLYPSITIELLAFYLFTFSICLFTGYIVNRYVPFHFNYIPVSKYNTFIISFIILFFVADCVYARQIPLFSISSGDESYEGGKTFGIPTVHVIMVTFTLFYSLYVFHQYISNKGRKLFMLFLLTLLPFIFLLQRSNIMYIAIGAMVIFVLSLKKVAVKKLILIGLFSLFSIFIFGYLGNLRSANGDSTFIPRMSGVTDDFLKGPIPNEFYWGYLYIASPVANLQHNINTEINVRPDLKSFIVYEMIPDFITKKANIYLDVHQRSFHQLNSFLNVGTIYANSYSYLAWPGLFLMYGYLILLMNYYYIVLSKLGKYKVTGIALMFNLIAFSNFSNTIQFSAFSIQLLFPIIFSIVNQFIKSKNKHVVHLSS
jgi:hypothetical protein